MTYYNRNLNKQDIKQFMTENYGTEWYNDFYIAMYSLRGMALITEALWNYIIKLDDELGGK